MNGLILCRTPNIGGAVVLNGELVACFSGNSGPARAEAFYLAATIGRTPAMKKLARESGISYRHIDRALDLRRMLVNQAP